MKKYTEEQIEGEVADMSAEGYPDGLRTNMLRAFAATLRQQGEQAGVDGLTIKFTSPYNIPAFPAPDKERL